MKTKLLLCLFCLSLAIALMSFSNPYTIKRITDANFKYEFYTTHKQPNQKDNKTYYWFKGGAIHHAESGIAGSLLHDKYLKFYHSNQLAEQGKFKNGLKVGLWKTWYPHGVLETSQKWINGVKNGAFKRFDSEGRILEQGKYKNQKKHGQWIYKMKDTINYKQDIVLAKKIKLSKEERAAKRAAKKEKGEGGMLNKIFGQKRSKKGPDAGEQSQNSTTIKKENFFKRLFKNKRSNKKGDGKGT